MVHLSTWNESQLYFSSFHYFPLLQYPSTSSSQRLYSSILACRWFQLFSMFLIFSFISAVFLSFLISWFFPPLIRHAPSVWCVYKMQRIFSCPWSDSLSFPSSVFAATPDKLFIFPNTFPFFAWKTNINPKSPCFAKLLLCNFLVLERRLLSKWEIAGHTDWFSKG